MATFTSLLRTKMTNAGMRQGDLARSLQVSSTSVYLWCSGRARPSLEHVAHLEQVLGCTRGELLVPLAYADDLPTVSTDD
jgi:transcriptional regulator with XRE-family HTH domain